MATKKTIFSIYSQNMLFCQEGERYVERPESYGAESQELGVYDTEAEALAAFEGFKSELSYEVIHTKSGLDTIAFDEITLNKELLETDDDGYEDIIESETLASAQGMTEEVRQAARKSELSYWAYLDYEEDGYVGIEQ